MQNYSPNEAKRLARLRFADEIMEMHEAGKSLREVTDRINYRLARTKLKTTLSKSSIQTFIKARKELNP